MKDTPTHIPTMKEFITYLDAKGLKESTIKEYLIGFRLFPHENLTQKAVNDFLQKHTNPKTKIISKNISSFMVNYLKFRDREDIKMPIKTGRVAQNVIEILTPEEAEFIKKILYSTFQLGDKGYGYVLMFDLCYSCALRVSELTYSRYNRGISASDFKWNIWEKDTSTGCELTVMGKGSKKRIVIVPPNLMKRIRKYFMYKRKTKGLSMGEPLWDIGDRSFQKFMKGLGELLKIQRLYPHLLRHCISEDTKILTLNGWKKYNQLKKEDNIFTFNLKNQKIEPQKIKEIHTHNYEGVMYNIKNQYLDCLITPEHKIVVKICREKQENKTRKDIWGNWTLINFDEYIKLANKRNTKFRVSGIVEDRFQKESIGIAKAGILGWLLTDGHIQYKRRRNPYVSISQSLTANPKKCRYIEELLINSKIAYTKNIQKKQINKFSRKEYQMVEFALLNGGNKGKIRGTNNDWLWEYITYQRTPKNSLLQLKKEELEEIYKCMMMGDGTKTKELRTQNKERIDFFRALCCLLGKRTRLGSGKNGFSDKLYHRTYISNKTDCQLLSKHIKKIENYKGVVWCPEVDNSTFIAERNGLIFITGNSRATEIFGKEGIKLQDVQILLGHRSPQTTARYLHSDEKESREKMKRLLKDEY